MKGSTPPMVRNSFTHRALSARTLGALLLTLLTAFALAAVALAPEVSAAPVYNPFSGPDLTQATPYPCKVAAKPYCFVPTVSAASYFNTTMISGRAYVHYPGDVDYDIGPSAGQGIGVMCWLAGPGSVGGIWEKVDARLTVGGVNPSVPHSSSLWIGYVNDAYVNLSYADRVNYVPHC